LENFKCLIKTGVDLQNSGQKPDQKLNQEQVLINQASSRVWQNLQSRQQYSSKINLHSGSHLSFNFSLLNFSKKRISIPLPAVAAAAVIVVLLAAFLFSMIRTGQPRQQSDFTNFAYNNSNRSNIILAAEEELPVFPTVDLNGVLQFLGSDGSNILIMRLPESSNFLRAGEPAIIRAADYTRRTP
jgi:hypothetical protein